MKNLTYSENFKSQYGQDKIVLDLLNYKTNGFFIEIGAHDGYKLSNTYVLEKEYNWNGLCVEPNPKLVEKILQYRTCKVENKAVYSYTGEADFLAIDAHGGINDPTISDNVVGRRTTGAGIKETDKLSDLKRLICVQTITPEDLFKKHNVPQIVDYLSIDVEGAELLILENIPFESYCFKVLTVEHNKSLGEERKKRAIQIKDLLTKHGYELHKEIGADFVFTKFV